MTLPGSRLDFEEDENQERQRLSPVSAGAAKVKVKNE